MGKKTLENNLVLETIELSGEAIRNYLTAASNFAREKINQEEYQKAVDEYLDAKKRVAILKEQVLSKDDTKYYHSLDFVVELTKEDVDEATKEERAKLAELRKDGEYKANAIKEEINNIALKRNIKFKEKRAKIAELKVELAKAKEVQKANKEQVDKLVRQATFITKAYGKEYYRFTKATGKRSVVMAEKIYDNHMRLEVEDFEQKKVNLDKKELKFLKFEHASRVAEIERDLTEQKYYAKNVNHNAYLTNYAAVRTIKNLKMSPAEKMSLSWENYKHKFKFKDWLLRNSLYIVIIVFFVICAIIAQTQGNPLLTARTIQTIFTQSSTKVFFSLGVAGLILLGGTDLSIGRMTGMAASFSCLCLSQLAYETNIGKFDMTMIGPAVGIVLGIFLCVFSTTLFSALAGFFTAKFKMHPFITTLSTQLLIYGLMMVCFSQVPAFTMNATIKNGIVGQEGWQLILYAVIAIILVWFIWNKTKFGKNMYAVGDNKEAAKVSGINVFAVTMGVFVMAGILYGLGGFLEGARIGNANPSTAFGTELDAIAACVIGGISFSGGKGKVSGAVVGTIIFTTLTYCLTYIGLDINFQYIFKGVIILAAVCLDSLKLLKKQ